MARINLRRRHDEDSQYRQMCREKVLKYERAARLWRTYIDTLTTQQLLDLAGMKKVQRLDLLKEHVYQEGAQKLEELIEFWQEEEQRGSSEPLAVARL